MPNHRYSTARQRTYDDLETEDLIVLCPRCAARIAPSEGMRDEGAADDDERCEICGAEGE